MKREINFRIGKGRITETRKALSAKNLIATMRFLGMPEEEIRAELQGVMKDIVPTKKRDHHSKGPDYNDGNSVCVRVKAGEKSNA